MKEFEQKYAEKEKQLQEMKYKLELKQKWNNENMAALNQKPLNRPRKPFLLTTKKKFQHKINIRTNAYHLLNTCMLYFIIFYLPFLRNFILHNTTNFLLYVTFFTFRHIYVAFIH